MGGVYFIVTQGGTGLRFLTPSSLAPSTSGERAPRKVKFSTQVRKLCRRGRPLG